MCVNDGRRARRTPFGHTGVTSLVVFALYALVALAEKPRDRCEARPQQLRLLSQAPCVLLLDVLTLPVHRSLRLRMCTCLA